MSKGVKFDYIEIDGHRLNSDHKGSAVSMYVAFANYFLDKCGEDIFLEQYGDILNVSKDESKLSNAFSLRDGLFIEIRVANNDKIKAIKKVLTAQNLIDKTYLKIR